MTEFKKTVEIVPMYCPTEDRTFLMEEVRIGSILVREKLVGWYYGEPNDEDTKIYSKASKDTYEAIHMTEEDAIKCLEEGVYDE